MGSGGARKKKKDNAETLRALRLAEQQGNSGKETQTKIEFTIEGTEYTEFGADAGMNVLCAAVASTA
jgi:hypothetical protein